MRPILERIFANEIVLSDGAIGTILLSKNMNDIPCPEYVNIVRMELLEEIASQYLEAGSEIIQTNTFGASSIKLSSYGLDDKAEIINKNAVSAVKNAVGNRAYISGSCGPSGKILKPYGDLEYKDLFESYLKQIAILIHSGVDIICIETMSDINEAVCAVKAAREISDSIPVMASMTFDPTPRGFFTMMGVNIENAVTNLKEAGANIIGSNCGNGIDNMILIAEEFKKVSDIPVIIQSNAGIPVLSKNEDVVYPESPSYMAERIKNLIRLKVSVIGGCCGTTPDHIKEMRKVIDSTTYS